MGDPNTGQTGTEENSRQRPNSAPAQTTSRRQVHHVAGEALAVEQGSLAATRFLLDEAVAESSLLAFRLAQQTYAVGIDSVDEIIEMVTMARLPRASEVIEGVINLRGEPVPILNLRQALNLPVLPPGLHTPIIIGKVTGTTVGLVVDEVIDVISIPAKQITPASRIFGESIPDLPFLNGVAFRKGESLLLLDLDHIFGARTAEVFEQVMALIASDDELLQPPQPAQGEQQQRTEEPDKNKSTDQA